MLAPGVMVLGPGAANRRRGCSFFYPNRLHGSETSARATSQRIGERSKTQAANQAPHLVVSRMIDFQSNDHPERDAQFMRQNPGGQRTAAEGTARLQSHQFRNNWTS